MKVSKTIKPIEIITELLNKKKEIENKTGKYCNKYNRIISNLFMKNY